MGTTLEIQLALDGKAGPLDLKMFDQRMATQTKTQLNQRFGKPYDLPSNQILNQHCNQLISETFERAQSLASALSFFDSSSLLSRYNLGELNLDSHRLSARVFNHLDPRHPDSRSSDELQFFSEVLGKAKILAERFPRGFSLDPRGLGKVDLGGIAKGAVVDHAYEWILTELNRRLEGDPVGGLIAGPGIGSSAQLSVNAGGDLRLNGAGAVEVRVPNSSGLEKRYNLQLMGAAVATSSHQGLYMAVGSTSADYASEFQNRSRAATVSVIAETCVWADGFAKIAFQYDLAECISSADATEFGLQAVLSFDREGDLISAHEWNASADSSG